MICLNCGNENKDTNINCEYCGKELPKKEELNKGRGVTTKSYIIMILMLLLPIVILLTSIYVMFNFKNLIGFEKEKPSNSVETTGVLDRFEDCYYDGEEFCIAVYKYKVDGIEYEIRTHFSSPKDDHNKENIVHYNEDNPEDSSLEFIEDDFSSMVHNTIAVGYIFISGFFVIIIVIITVIFIKNKKEENKI